MPLALGLLFFVSGASALAFETLWFHQAGLALGHSVWASSLVLAGFMAGLGLGNFIAARRGDRLGNPLRVYAIVELLVAGSGVLLVLGLPKLGAALAPVLGGMHDSPALLNATRLGIAFLLLLVPSTAMGLTLPVLTKALGSLDTSFGTALGRLYAWNTFGAVAGTLAAELWLIESLGIRGTATVAALLNVLAAATAFRLAPRVSGEATPDGAWPDARTRRAAWAAEWPWLTSALLSGAVLLALEVVWFRFLALYVQTSSVAFALMLAIVLSGIAVGSALASGWLERRPLAHSHAPAVGFAAGAVCVASYAASPWVVELAQIGVVTRPAGVLTLGIPLMFPVSMLSGVFFTLVGTAMRAGLRSATETTGALTLFNTLGAALGALVGGFLLLPQLGMEKSLFLLSLAYAVAGGLAFARTRVLTPPSRVALAALGIAVVLFPFGSMRHRHIEATLHRFGKTPGAEVWIREGLTETVLYLANEFAGKTISHRLITNAISMSSSDQRNRRYMKLFAYLPVAVHPGPKNALLISFGVGATAKALTDTRELRMIDVVDISRDILEMSHVVHGNQNPLDDPRVRVHVEDGRQFLRATTSSYDIITGEPPPPALAGVANLYTREFFELVRARLAAGGITTYWLPTHSISERNSLSIVRAFCDVFADCSLWNGVGPDLMLVGTNGAAGPVSPERFRRQWLTADVATEMKALGFEHPAQLGALFIGDAAYLGPLAKDSPPVVDDYPKRIVPDRGFAHFANQMPPVYREWTDAAKARDRFLSSPLIQRLWPKELVPPSLERFGVQQIINDQSYQVLPRLGENLPRAHTLLAETKLETPILWLLGSDADKQNVVPNDLSPTIEPGSASAHPASLLFHLGIRQISERRYAPAARSLEWAAAAAETPPRSEGRSTPPDTPDVPRTIALRIYALCMAERSDEARALYAASSKRLDVADLVGYPELIESVCNRAPTTGAP